MYLRLPVLELPLASERLRALIGPLGFTGPVARLVCHGPSGGDFLFPILATPFQKKGKTRREKYIKNNPETDTPRV